MTEIYHRRALILAKISWKEITKYLVDLTNFFFVNVNWNFLNAMLSNCEIALVLLHKISYIFLGFLYAGICALIWRKKHGIILSILSMLDSKVSLIWFHVKNSTLSSSGVWLLSRFIFRYHTQTNLNASLKKFLVLKFDE